MLSKIRFTKKEIKHILISIFVLGFVFGFDDGSNKFIFSNWLFNLIKITLVVSISLLIKIIGHKIAAIKYGSLAEYNLWSLRRIGLSKSSKLHIKLQDQLAIFLNKITLISKIKSIPLGIILPLGFVLISAILTNNKLFIPFAATGIILLSSERAHRLGKKFVRLTEVEEAKIHLAGNLFCLILIMFASIITTLTSLNLSSFVIVNIYLILFNMLPIPPLDGGKIFFGGITLYIFSITFLTISIFLITLSSLSIISIITISIIISSLIATIFHYIKHG